MNIYQRAIFTDEDYTDPMSGNTYKIRAFQSGLTPKGVEVVNDCGQTIGYVPVPLVLPVLQERG